MVNARECDVVMHSVASVCLSVRVSIFESLDLETYWCAEQNIWIKSVC